MSLLNNFKIVFKITLIVALMAAVTIGVVVYAADRVHMVDDAYSAIIEHQDKAAMTATRASRSGETFLSSVYQLAAETTDQGNAELLAQAAEARKSYEDLMAEVRKELPEKSALIDAAGPQIRAGLHGLRSSHRLCLESYDAGGELEGGGEIEGRMPARYAGCSRRSDKNG